MEIIGSRNQEVLLTEVLQGKWSAGILEEWSSGSWRPHRQQKEEAEKTLAFPSCDHPLASKGSREEVMTSGSPARYPTVLSSSYVPNTMEVL